MFEVVSTLSFVAACMSGIACGLVSLINLFRFAANRKPVFVRLSTCRPDRARTRCQEIVFLWSWWLRCLFPCRAHHWDFNWRSALTKNINSILGV